MAATKVQPLTSLNFQMRTTGRSGEIECREGSCTLLIPWEMSGSPHYDILLAPLDFTKWSAGCNGAIQPAKQQEILAALRAWAYSEGIRSDIDFPTGRQETHNMCAWHDCSRGALAGSAYCRQHFDTTLLKAGHEKHRACD